MAIPPTQLTLLARLQDPKDQEAWQRFESRYRDLIVGFAIRQGMQSADAEDIAQAVFQSLFRTLPGFRMDPAKGRFRSYLFRAVRNEISRANAKAARPSSLAAAVSLDDGDPEAAGSLLGPAGADDPAERAFEEQWIDHHFHLAMMEVRRTFAPESVAMFDRLIRGEPVESIATAYATTTQAVHKVKQRIRDRMKELVAQQIAEEG